MLDRQSRRHLHAIERANRRGVLRHERLRPQRTRHRYWRQKGIAGHNIDAYAAFDPRNAECARQAIALFGGAYIGLALPLSAQQQDVWDVPSLWSRLRNQDAPGSWGGHAVPVLAYDSSGLTCVTWGAKKRMTWEFFTQYCDEAYAPLSHDLLNVQEKIPKDWTWMRCKRT